MGLSPIIMNYVKSRSVWGKGNVCIYNKYIYIVSYYIYIYIYIKFYMRLESARELKGL